MGGPPALRVWPCTTTVEAPGAAEMVWLPIFAIATGGTPAVD
jgi:hypothetical protein